jgi:transposase
MCGQQGIAYRPFNAKEFSKWVPVALSFYRTARAREEAMIENLDRGIKERDLLRAVLVIGGFHSRNIFNALQRRGYTVTLISPRFAPSGDPTQHEQYLEVLKSKWTGKEVPSTKFQDASAKLAVPSSKIN